MKTKEKLAAAAALLLALALYALVLQVRLAPRSTNTPDPQAGAVANPEEPEIDAARIESGRQALAQSPPDELDSSAARPLDEAALRTLEIQVVRADGVAHEARAWLVAGYYRELPTDLRTPPAGYQPVFVAADAEGVLRFPGLAPGPYRTAIELDGYRLEQSVRLLEEREIARIVIRLGTTRVEGFVYDDAGIPAAGASVRICRPGYGRNPPPFECFARTDANGFYRIEQVASGLQSAAAHLVGAEWSKSSMRECVVPITGVLRVDFGAPALEGVSWTGVARNPAGDPVPGPGEIRIHDEDRDEFRAVPLQVNGSFELRLRPGSHHLWIQPAGFFPQQVDLGLFDVPADGFRRDLLVPGARLRLRLTLPDGWEGTPEPALQSANQSLLKLAPLGDGSWVHDGLAPGDYVLRASPLFFEETRSAEYPFTLAPGAHGLELEVRLEIAR